MRLGLAAGLMAAILWLAAPAAAEQVPVRAAAHDGYGRIVFNWAFPVPYSAVIEGGRLVVRFGEPIEASYGNVIRTLGGYITGAEPSGDGRSVIFALSGDYDLRDFPMGRAVVVDLMKKVPADAQQSPPAEEAPPPPRKAAAGPEPAAAPAPARGRPIGVRTGEHEGFSRIVFDWPSKVGYRVSKTGGAVTITFESPADVDIGRLGARPPRNVLGASSELRDGRRTVTLTVAETSRVRDLLSGSKVVVDVMAPGPAAAAAGPAKETPPAKPPASAAAKAPPGPPAKAPGPPAKAAPGPAKAAASPVKKPPTPVMKAPDRVASAAPGGTEKSPPPAKGAGPKAPKPSAVTETSPPPASRPAAIAPAAPQKPVPLVPPTEAPPPAGAAPGSGDIPPEAEGLAAMAGVKISEPGAAGGLASMAGVTITEAQPGAPPAGAVTLRFDWEEPVGAAVFRRAGYLWVVFDKIKEVDQAALRAAGGNVIRSLQQIPSDHGTVLRLATVSGVNPTPARDGMSWLLYFLKQPLRPRTPIETNPQPNSPVGARLFLSVAQPGKAIPILDPEVGDNLVVVPVIPLGHGVEREYVYPQVRILVSSQGVVVQPRIDDLRIRPLRQGIELTSTGGLQVSPVSAQVAADSKLGAMRPLTRVFDFKKWKPGDPENFNMDRDGLFAAVARSKDKTREQARLNLARFYFANGFGAEALGVLHMVAEDRPEALDEPEFRALRGANRYLMVHYDAAAEDFAHPSLEENDEGAFWRAALVAAGGDLRGASRDLKRTGGIIRPYPKALKVPLGLLVVEAAIEIGDIKLANHYLKLLGTEETNAAQRGKQAYVQGRLKELEGDFDTAVSYWEEAIASPHGPSRAKATVARAELLLKQEKMTPLEAIEELEKLRFAWRGDDFEFELLRRLGRLYMAADNYRDGLRTMRQAATHFRTHERAAEVTQEMSDIFAQLYLEDGAEIMAPVTAIALYDEFKELTPAGELGDEMIRKLADRLVSVDLLENGAKILESQVKFRLQGVEKARVGARLAEVRNMNLEYDLALEALQESDTDGLPEDLATQRRHLKARAMMGEEEPENALALLEEDESVEADLLRTEIYSRGNDWRNAAKTLRRLVRTFGAKPREPLDFKQSRYVLNLAIALTLSDNDQGLGRIKRDYGEAMAGSQFSDAFRLIASPQARGLVDVRTIAEKVSDVEGFQDFMTAYRERLGINNLSSAIN